MLKYTETSIGLKEVPDEISLCINLSNCPRKCKNCHSPHLKEDIGEPLTEEALDSLVENNKGISCICLMGGEKSLSYVNSLFHYCKSKYPHLKRAIYVGAPCFPAKLDLRLLNYIKYGPYIEEKGPLNNPNTNQKFKKLTWGEYGLNVEDITHKFWE